MLLLNSAANRVVASLQPYSMLHIYILKSSKIMCVIIEDILYSL